MTVKMYECLYISAACLSLYSQRQCYNVIHSVFVVIQKPKNASPTNTCPVLSRCPVPCWLVFSYSYLYCIHSITKIVSKSYKVIICLWTYIYTFFNYIHMIHIKYITPRHRTNIQVHHKNACAGWKSNPQLRRQTYYL